MKKSCIIFLILFSLINLSACNSDKECNHYYDEVIKEATYSSDGELRKTCVICNEEIVETIPQLASPIEFTVRDMSTLEEEQEPLVMPDGMEIPQLPVNWVILEIEIENISEDDIYKISGTLVISDGNQTLDLLCSIEEHIAPGESVCLTDYGFQVANNDLTIADNMISGTDFDNLTFEFTLSEVN